MTTTPIERTVRYATSVAELTDAWQMVMTYLDMVGPDPSVTIRPYWRISAENPDGTSERRFEVVVEGMQEEA